MKNSKTLLKMAILIGASSKISEFRDDRLNLRPDLDSGGQNLSKSYVLCYVSEVLGTRYQCSLCYQCCPYYQCYLHINKNKTHNLNCELLIVKRKN
jgi:hypothetical protein